MAQNGAEIVGSKPPRRPKEPPSLSDPILSRFLRDDRKTLVVSRVLPGTPEVVRERIRTRLIQLGLTQVKEGVGWEDSDDFESPWTFLRFGNPSPLRRALDIASMRWVEVAVESVSAGLPRTRVTLECPLANERWAAVVGGASLSGTVGGVVGGGFATLLVGSAGVVGATLGVAAFAVGSVVVGLPVPGFRAYRDWAHRQAEGALEDMLDGLANPGIS